MHLHRLLLFVFALSTVLNLPAQEADGPVVFTGTIEMGVVFDESTISFLDHRRQSRNRVTFYSDSFYLQQPLHPHHAEGSALPYFLYRKGQYPPLYVFAHAQVAIEHEPSDDGTYGELSDFFFKHHSRLDTTHFIQGIECIGYKYVPPVPHPRGDNIVTISWVAKNLVVTKEIAYVTSDTTGPALFGGFMGTGFIELGSDTYRNGVHEVRIEAVYISPNVEFERYDFLLFEERVLQYERKPSTEAWPMTRDLQQHIKASFWETFDDR